MAEWDEHRQHVLLMLNDLAGSLTGRESLDLTFTLLVKTSIRVGNNILISCKSHEVPFVMKLAWFIKFEVKGYFFG
jgi:hypothetical protein